MADHFYYDIGYGTQVEQLSCVQRRMEKSDETDAPAEPADIWPGSYEVQKRELQMKKEKSNENVDPARQRIQFRAVLDRDHFHYAFNTNAYMQDFYGKVEEPAMQMMLTYLPMIVCRLPKGGQLLDIGAGPTIHVPVAFRNSMDKNRAELMRWYKGESKFSWAKTLHMIALQESTMGKPINHAQMEEEAKQKVRGILYCDVHDQNILPGYPGSSSDQFSIVTTFFCIEYCCKTEREYRNAIRNCVRTVKPGGYFIMGSVMEETWCAFGGIQFECFYTTQDLIIDSLRNSGIDVDGKDFQLYEVNGIYLLYGRKMSRAEYAQTMVTPPDAEQDLPASSASQDDAQTKVEREHELLSD